MTIAAVAVHDYRGNAIEQFFILGPTVLGDFCIYVWQSLFEFLGEEHAPCAVFVVSRSVAGISRNEQDLGFSLGREGRR